MKIILLFLGFFTTYSDRQSAQKIVQSRISIILIFSGFFGIISPKIAFSQTHEEIRVVVNSNEDAYSSNDKLTLRSRDRFN